MTRLLMSFFQKKSKKVTERVALPKKNKSGSALQKRRRVKILLVVALLFFASALIYGLWIGIAWISENKNFRQDSVFKQPVTQIEFSTNGVLTAQWARRFLSLPRGIDIMEVDIFKIKQAIEACPQVKKVTVERRFPGAIKVSILERKPILKLLIRDGRLTKEMLIDEEGVLFPGEQIPQLDRQMMPFLSGIILKKKKNGGYENIASLDRVRELLILAKTKYWPIYAQMEVISIAKLKNKRVPWSQINVRCACSPEVIFKDTDFDEQLKRLDFILNTPKVRKSLPVARIDLACGKDAIVRFKK